MASFDRSELFARMPVRKAVLRQIIPAVASQMITLIYNLADTYFVGLLNDPDQTAAVTVATSSFVMLTAISNLFGVGGASCLAGALGKKQPERAKEIAALSFWGGIVSALLFSLIFSVLARPILQLGGATADTYALAFGYAKWAVIIGGPFTVLNTLLANLVRAEGSANLASFGVSFGGLLNILLDPLFVLPQFLNMGAAGAGLATAISNLAATVFFLIYILRRRERTVLRIGVRYLRYGKTHLRPVLSVGLPSALQMTLTVAAVSAHMNFVSRYSTEAVAALGIVKKLDQLPLFVSIGIANGLLPLLAYNHASGDYRRRSQAFRFGVTLSVAFAVLCLVVYELFAPVLASLFIADRTTIGYAAVFLRQMVTAMPMVAICYPMIVQFQAMGKVRQALIASVLRKGLLDVPLLFFMDRLLPLYGCMWVQPIVDTLALIVVLVFYRQIRRKEKGRTLR